MTIKEITYLALLLIAGLIFNRCAFEGDATELTRAGKSKGAAASIARQSEATAKSLEKKIDRLGQRMDEFGERMGEIDERVGEEFEDLGDELSEETDKIGEQTAEGVSNDFGDEAEPGGKKTSLVHYLSAPVNVDLALDVPRICAETTIDFRSNREGTMFIGTQGGSDLESPAIETVSGDQLRAVFRAEEPSMLELQLPRNIPYVRFSTPQQVKLGLSNQALLMKLDAPNVRSLVISRTAEEITIRHAEWTLRVTGASQPLHLTDLDGKTLGRIERDESNEVRLDFSAVEKQGGAK